MQKDCCRAGLRRWYNKVSGSHEGMALSLLHGHCWRPLSAAAAAVAATSQAQALGKTDLETRPVSCAPWNVLIVSSDRLQQGWSPVQWAGCQGPIFGAKPCRQTCSGWGPFNVSASVSVALALLYVWLSHIHHLVLSRLPRQQEHFIFCQGFRIS